MAITQTLCFSGRYQDCGSFIVSDTTVYGVSAPDRRIDAARVLVPAKMDENQILSFITGIDNTDPLNALEWTVTSQGIGAYRVFYFNILFYDVLVTYRSQAVDAEGVITRYPHIIYVSSSEKYYTPKVDNVLAVEPEVTVGWENSWSEYDITDLKNQILTDKITVLTHDDIVTCEYEECLVEMVDKRTDKELCGICAIDDEFVKLLRAEFMFTAAQSNNWQGKATRSEVILKEAKKKFCC